MDFIIRSISWIRDTYSTHVECTVEAHGTTVPRVVVNGSSFDRRREMTSAATRGSTILLFLR